MTPLGLTTYQWNNNIKSLVLLAAFPFLLLGIVILCSFAIGWLSMNQQGVVDPIIYEQFGMMSRDGSYSPWDFAMSLSILTAPFVLGIAVLWISVGTLFHEAIIKLGTNARKVNRVESPELYNLLENLCISRGMTMPKLFIIDSLAMNAFASGLSEQSYSITVTRGLLDALNKEELEAVLAHELSHIRHRDVRLLIVTILFGGFLSFFADMAWRSLRHMPSSGDRRGRNAFPIMLSIALILSVGYFCAFLFRLALSRRREYLADAGAVELTKNPEGLIHALEKISGHAEMPSVPDSMQAMMIENPPGIAGLFATHPPIEARIAVLRRLAGTPSRGASIIPEVG
jgi:heat shock protein HtpX